MECSPPSRNPACPASLAEGGKLERSPRRRSSWPPPIGKTARPSERAAEPLAEGRSETSGGRAFKGPGEVAVPHGSAASAAGPVAFPLRGRGPGCQPPAPERVVPSPRTSAQPAGPLGRQRASFCPGRGGALRQTAATAPRGLGPRAARALGTSLGRFTRNGRCKAKIRRKAAVRNNLGDNCMT